MTGDGTYIYSYNALNQLTQVKRASDNAVIATYTYNHNGLRRSKTVNGVTTNYNWDASGHLVKESSPSGSTYYYYDTSGGLVGLKKNNITYVVHDNLRGDIESITDTNGNIVAQYHFDPWGNQITYSGTLTQSFRYAGYYYDDETGLYYLKSRYYSPALGRFLTRDGIGYVKRSEPQTLNLYSYCGNDPVRHTDPNGNWANDIEKFWAQDHMSKDDYKKLDSYSSEYRSATKARQLQLNKEATAIRARYNIPSFGPTASSSSKKASSSSSSSSSIPSQIWKGMTCEGWTPYKQTAGAVVFSGTVVVTAGGASAYYTAGGSAMYISNYAADVLGPPPPGSLPAAIGGKGLEWVGVDPLGDFLFGNPN